MVCAAPGRDRKSADGAKQGQETAIVVNGQKLNGPNSSAEKRSGRLFIPVLAVTRALGDVVGAYETTRTLTIRRQTGVTAEFDAKLGQVRENGVVRLSISNTTEIVFPPNQETLYLPAEILSELLDVSIRFDDDANAVLITRGLPTDDSVRKGEKHSFGEIYRVDYDYGLNSYSSFSSHNLGLNVAGRLADGRFTFISGVSATSSRGWRLGTGTFTLDRPNGQRFVAGDLGTGSELQLLSTNVRGAEFQVPVGRFRVTAFAGKTFSGLILPPVVNGDPVADTAPRRPAIGYDTNIFGALASGSLGEGRSPLVFSAGVMRFSGPGRDANVLSGGIKYETPRFRFQGDVGVGNFDGVSTDGKRVRGLGQAFDLSVSYQATDHLSVQGRYAYIGEKFLSPQSGSREPLDLKTAGVTWAPKKWFTTSITANTTTRPGDPTRHDSFVTGSVNISRATWPQIFLSHTESHSAQLGGTSFTLLTASKEFSRFRAFINATRIRTFRTQALNAQAGVNFRVNDLNSIEVSQGVGSRGSLNGQIDWRRADLFNKRLSFAAGVGYNHGNNSAFTAFERLSASVQLPRQNSLQLSYTHTGAGPTVMVSLRGTLFRKKSSDVVGTAPVSEINSFGTIRGRVYQDIDLNGKYDAGVDQPQANVQVRVDGNRYVESRADGTYDIDTVKTGPHQVYVDLLSVRADLTLLDGAVQSMTQMRGRDSIVDFRLVRTGRISGLIWLDLNENGKMDDDEQPLSDVRVVTASGRDTLTDSNGAFSIADLPPGEHIVTIDEKTLPEKTCAASKSISIHVLPGREMGHINLAVIMIPAEVKHFGSKP